MSLTQSVEVTDHTAESLHLKAKEYFTENGNTKVEGARVPFFLSCFPANHSGIVNVKELHYVYGTSLSPLPAV